MADEQNTPSFSYTEVVEAASHGEEAAFETLYKQIEPLLKREIARFFSGREDREDALQETYLKIFEKLGTLREPTKFPGWALVICSRVCLNRLRAEAHRSGLEELRPETTGEDGPGLDLFPAVDRERDWDPETKVGAAHVTEVVEAVVAELPINQRDCLILWMEGWSAPEIAEELELNVSTVRSNVSYARKKVEKTLRKMEREGTFDYRELSTDPMEAFRILLEQLLGGGRMVPAPGGLPPIASGGGSLLARTARDPLTSVIAIVLVVAIAIGVALAIQTRTYQTTTEQRDQPVAGDQTLPVTTPEAAPGEAPGTNPGNGEPPATPAPAVTPAPTPVTPAGPGGGGATSPAQTPVNGTSLIRPDGRLTAFRSEDYGGVTPNTLTNAEQSLTGGLTRLTNNYSGFPMVFQGLTDEDGLLTVNLFFGNYTGHKVRLEEVTDISVRNKDGELIATRASFVPNKPITATAGEELTIKLPFPDSYVTKKNLPPFRSEGVYNDTGVNVYGRVNYVIVDTMEEFSAKEISELPPLTKPYPQNYPNQQNVLVYVRDMVEEGDNILCYMGVKNDTKATMTVDRFEYLRFYGVDDKTRAEGRVPFPKNFTLKPGEEGYLLITVPKPSYDNFSLLNSIGHNEDVIYTLHY